VVEPVARRSLAAGRCLYSGVTLFDLDRYLSNL
jgi:hypothetical protein